MDLRTFAMRLLFLLFLSSVSAFPAAIKQVHPSIKQISADAFTCDSSDPLLNAICQVGLKKINGELEALGVSVDRDGLLFSFDDGNDVKLNTGHSCTVTAKVTHQHASARISSSTRLDLTGNSLTEPLAIRLNIPVSLSAKIDVKQRFGVRILGSCSNTGSDSYSLKASLSTTADVMIGFSLNPSLGVLDSGDYGLVIEPTIAVISRLRNTALKFRVSGVSPISSALTFVTGFSSTLLKSVTALFTGESITTIFTDALAFDIGVPVVLGIGSLPRPLEEEIWYRLLGLNIAERAIEKKAKGFGPDLEDKLRADLRSALKLGADGKRVFIIKRDVVDLLRLNGLNADVYIDPPVDPSISCDQQAKQVCSSSDLNIIYSQCVPLRQKCDRQREEYREMYTPSNVIVSTPKVAVGLTATTPPPTVPPSTRPPITTDCVPRPGQEVEC